MSTKSASISWWIIAIVFTLSLAVYQRLTGPTHPKRGNIEMDGTVVKYKLLRSSDSDKAAKIKIKNITSEIVGKIKYKRFNVSEEWKVIDFKMQEDILIAELPPEPPAGKLEYIVTLYQGDEPYVLNDEPVIIRFKGPVPAYVLIPHILLMFLAMLFSTRTGIEAFRNGKLTLNYAGVTLITLLLGGMFLGPVVQKFAFGAYWTGWPFGQDLTDNKTLVAFVAWIIAYLKLRKNPGNRFWPIFAAIILLAIYLIPHSMFGSELDYSTGEVITGE